MTSSSTAARPTASRAGPASPSDQSPNYDFVLRRALEFSSVPAPKILDYGCGRGDFVALGRARGHDVSGADSFTGAYAAWANEMAPAAATAFVRIEGGRIDAPDAHYDIVVSNYVFEHIAEPLPVLREIDRVLKPGGVFLALFPTVETWFEGHLGLYFPHWLRRWPGLQLGYLELCRRCGLGYYGRHLTPAVWARDRQRLLREAVFHHRSADVRRWWETAFGAAPRSDARAYVLYRLAASRLRRLLPLARSRLATPLLALLCHVRAGRVLVVVKPTPVSSR